MNYIVKLFILLVQFAIDFTNQICVTENVTEFAPNSVPISACSEDRIYCDNKNVCLVLDCDYNYKEFYVNIDSSDNDYDCAHSCNDSQPCLPQCNTSSYLQRQETIMVSPPIRKSIVAI